MSDELMSGKEWYELYKENAPVQIDYSLVTNKDKLWTTEEVHKATNEVIQAAEEAAKKASGLKES